MQALLDYVLHYKPSVPLSVVLDVDHTIIKCEKTHSHDNPYPHFMDVCEGYMYFRLSKYERNTNSMNNNHRKYRRHPLSHSLSTQSSPHSFNDQSQSQSHTKRKRMLPANDEHFIHYHCYIRPGFRSLMKTLRYLQKTCGTRVGIASMARKNYLSKVLKGLKQHCTESGKLKSISSSDCFPELQVKKYKHSSYTHHTKQYTFHP